MLYFRNKEIHESQKRAFDEQPFSLFIIYPLFFIVLLIYEHGNSVYYHENPYIITKTPILFP